ncbi:MAG: DUF5615 family PIN-like protein [bacterium]|nr:DUF5615 family PIN-like protein [bacterium]
MLRFLLDANISHETALFLRDSGFDVETVHQHGLRHASDLEIAQKAHELERMIVTFDLDFGEIYRFTVPGISVLVLRIRNQTVESVNYYLGKLLDSKEFKKIDTSGVLIIAGDNGFRIRK